MGKFESFFRSLEQAGIFQEVDEQRSVAENFCERFELSLKFCPLEVFLPRSWETANLASRNSLGIRFVCVDKIRCLSTETSNNIFNAHFRRPRFSHKNGIRDVFTIFFPLHSSPSTFLRRIFSRGILSYVLLRIFFWLSRLGIVKRKLKSRGILIFFWFCFCSKFRDCLQWSGGLITHGYDTSFMCCLVLNTEY